MLALDNLESADAASDIHAQRFRIFFRLHFQTRSFHRELTCSHAELNKAAHLLDVFFLDIKKWVEVFYFAGDLATELAGIELRDPFDPVLPVKDRRPAFAGSRADRANQAYAGDNYSSRHLCPHKCSARLSEFLARHRIAGTPCPVRS